MIPLNSNTFIRDKLSLYRPNKKNGIIMIGAAKNRNNINCEISNVLDKYFTKAKLAVKNR